jgi:GntR family transcriptional regulator
MATSSRAAPTLPMPDLPADGGAPKYVQLKEALRRRILDGSYPPHARLPSESELGRHLGLSRITVRQALGDLESENLIFRLHGKGSFVSKPKATQDLARLEGLGEAMSRSGHDTVNQVLGVRRLAAPAAIAKQLQLPTGATVVELRRLRLLDRQPLSVDVSYFPADVGERLPGTELAQWDLLAIIENHLGLPLGRARLRIDAVPAPPAIARRLRIQAAQPLLKIERLIHTEAGRPIVHEFLHFRGDAFQYQIELDRRPVPA